MWPFFTRRVRSIQAVCALCPFVAGSWMQCSDFNQCPRGGLWLSPRPQLKPTVLYVHVHIPGERQQWVGCWFKGACMLFL